MKWDQIESKWALMTRRIRVDWDDERTGPTHASVGTVKRRDAGTATIADGQAAAAKDPEFKTSAK